MLSQAEVMTAPTPVLGGAAGAPPQPSLGAPEAAPGLGAELRRDLTECIKWQWLWARPGLRCPRRAARCMLCACTKDTGDAPCCI